MRERKRCLARHAVVMAACLTLYTAGSATSVQQPAGPRPPNIVLIYADDLGYADIGPFSTRSGADRPVTPNLDRMAQEGVRLTSFYVAQAVCSASRAALLTGSYSNRVGINGALNHTADYGLNLDEVTIAEVLKPRGYATAMFGKWHLGHKAPFLPLHQGFDEYLGLPYSNDMWPKHPQQKNFYPDLPLMDGDNVVKLDPDQSQLTTMYTERAVRFIERNRERPFFLYVAHAMPRSGRSWKRSNARSWTPTRSSCSRPTTGRGCPTAITPDLRVRSAKARGRRSRAEFAYRSWPAGPDTSPMARRAPSRR
jgi:arylsulfatase